jgi:site-specific DNA-methyltransferase (adenine-specific)
MTTSEAGAARIAKAAEQLARARKLAEGPPEPRIYYQDTHVTLWCGDMRDVLPILAKQGKRFAACITDPPYQETSLDWDRWQEGWLGLVAQVTDSTWCWGSARMFGVRWAEFAAAGWKLSQDVVGADDDGTPILRDRVAVWEKGNGSGAVNDRFRRVHEYAYHWYTGLWRGIYHETPRVPAVGSRLRPGEVVQRRDGRVTHQGDWIAKPYVNDGTRLMRSVIYASNMRGRAIHPTEKPAAVLIPLIEYSVPPGGTVLDVFAGSCSLGLAIRELNSREPDPARHRRAVLIEADEAMCAKAVEKRLSHADLFTA